MTVRRLALLLVLALLGGTGCRSSQQPLLTSQQATIDSLSLVAATREAEAQRLAAERDSLAAQRDTLLARLARTEALIPDTLRAQRQRLERLYNRRLDSLRQAYTTLVQRGVDLRSTARGTTLDVIYFESGATGISRSNAAKLDQVAARLRRMPANRRILVEGHSDDTPSARQNNRLISAERAAAVVRYLIERHGINPLRFETAGYGADFPAAPNDTEAGRRLNRRVRIALLDG